MKIRCSALGQVMTNSRKKGELSKTAQSYVKKWLKEKQYDRRIVFSSKQIEKGLIMEDEAIDFVGEYYGLGFVLKNEEHFSNDFVTGTPDLITGDTVRDIKCSWSLDTFPAYESELPNKDYYWQLQGYMWLTGKENAYLDYCLMNTPEHLIQSELRSEAYRHAKKKLSDKQAVKIRRRMTFDDVPTQLRIKTFEVPRNEEDIEAIKERVNECNTYMNQIKIKLS